MDKKQTVIINEYFDGELSDTAQIQLFEQLANNNELRTYFNNIQMLKQTKEHNAEPFPYELEESIYGAIKENEKESFFGKLFNNPFATMSYAFGVVLLILSLFLYSEYKHTREILEITENKMIEQVQLIKLLTNPLPEVEVIHNYENEVVVKPAM